MKKVASYFLIALLGGGSALTFNHFFSQPEKVIITEKNDESNPNAHFVNYTPEGSIDFTKAAELSLNAVVHIKTNTTVSYYDPFREMLYGNGKFDQKMQSSGSGVIISEDGYIVTNNHVIRNADEIEISLNDKKSYKAEIIGADPSTDIALLKIKDKGLPHISYGNSDNVKVGEWVLAVGNPYNLTSTVTAGIVSAKGRDINILRNDPLSGKTALESFIQTDAAVNPGNSGGALVNASGQLVGINTAIQSQTGAYSGYSFAVPVNIVKKVVNDLVEFGTVQRAYIGVSIRNIDKKLADEESISTLNGAYVSETMPNGAADEAGIKKGDVITKIGSVKISNVTELQEQVGQFRPGDNLIVTVLRDGKETEIPVNLKNLEGTTKIVKAEDMKVAKSLGAQLADVSDEEKEKLNIDGGVKIIQLNGGKLRSVGITEGFIINKVDKKPVANTEEFLEIMKNKSGGILLEGIYPNGKKAYYGFGL